MRKKLNKTLADQQKKKLAKDHSCVTEHSRQRHRELVTQGNFAIIFRIVDSNAYAACSSFLIIANCIFLAIETQVAAEDVMHGGTGSLPDSYTAMELIFLFCFFVEVGMRIVAYGSEFFFSGDRAWNIFDVLVVLVSLVEWIVDATASKGMGNTSFLRFLRIGRGIRAIRAVKVLQQFRELRLLLTSLTGSMRMLLWSLMLLVAVFYIFGILFTNAIYDATRTQTLTAAEEENLLEKFGTLERSVLHLFMCMSGGIDWGDVWTAMAPMGDLYKALFLVYVATTIFGIVNVVMGIFVENAMQAKENDREMILQEEMVAQAKSFRDIANLFHEFDLDDSGGINLQEFEKHLDDERAVAYFESLKLDVTQVSMIFQLLDTDNSGTVTLEEFVAGCQRLRGESRALDIAIISAELRSTQRYFERFEDALTEQLAKQTEQLAKQTEQLKGFAAIEHSPMSHRSLVPSSVPSRTCSRKASVVAVIVGAPTQQEERSYSHAEGDADSDIDSKLGRKALA